MRNNNILEPLLYFWEENQQYKIALSEKTSISNPPAHLSDTKLYDLALRGGIERAQEKDTEHLDSCPYCFGRWENWHHAVYLSDEQDNAPRSNFFCGNLEAAASSKNTPIEPIVSKSTCGRFLLSLYPQENSQNNFMFTLEILAEDFADHEGDHFQIRDANNQILLDGIMRNRRLARRTRVLTPPNLTKWTITQTASE